eukprot:2469561-Prymnesium_polylepis.2
MWSCQGGRGLFRGCPAVVRRGAAFMLLLCHHAIRQPRAGRGACPCDFGVFGFSCRRIAEKTRRHAARPACCKENSYLELARERARSAGLTSRSRLSRIIESIRHGEGRSRPGLR